jgi:hypothetical protein
LWQDGHSPFDLYFGGEQENLSVEETLQLDQQIDLWVGEHHLLQVLGCDQRAG